MTNTLVGHAWSSRVNVSPPILLDCPRLIIFAAKCSLCSPKLIWLRRLCLARRVSWSGLILRQGLKSNSRTHWACCLQTLQHFQCVVKYSRVTEGNPLKAVWVEWSPFWLICVEVWCSYWHHPQKWNTSGLPYLLTWFCLCARWRNVLRNTRDGHEPYAQLLRKAYSPWWSHNNILPVSSVYSVTIIEALQHLFLFYLFFYFVSSCNFAMFLFTLKPPNFTLKPPKFRVSLKAHLRCLRFYLFIITIRILHVFVIEPEYRVK